MAEFLLELFSEEIPARMQAKAADDLKRLVTGKLKDAGLKHGQADAYVTPRRLCLLIAGLDSEQPDISEERRGPRADAPQKAIEGFLRGAGVTQKQVEIREEKKGTFLYAIIERKGRKTSDVLAEFLPDIIKNFPWPKSQRWGEKSLRWVRPLHSILCLMDGEAVFFDLGDGLQSGNQSQGHRFLAPETFVVSTFADYKAHLDAANIMLNPADRKILIKAQAIKLAKDAELNLLEDEGLLNEVVGLAEYPVVLMGEFDKEFLDVPQEALTSAMKSHQKYFSVVDDDGKLANKFIFVSNMKTDDKGAKIIDGNERVLRARLADTKFFWDQDLKITLDDRFPALEDIVFHAKLGTVGERVERLVKLSGYIAEKIGADVEQAKRAAQLCKADLVSGMVGEFADLQGLMGKYYAEEQEETDVVANAIADHYSPKGPHDQCPSNLVSVSVALAEKLDSLVGFFAADEKPTGSKDPFALRRAALGVVRLILENNIRLDLVDVFSKAYDCFLNQKIFKNGVYSISEIIEFLRDRMKVLLRDEGISHGIASAVLEVEQKPDLVRLMKRITALQNFSIVDEDDSLLEGYKRAAYKHLLVGYKRAANILKVEEKKDGPITGDASAGTMPEEKELFAQLTKVANLTVVNIESENFEGAMGNLATLRTPIDAFFDKVTVNSDNDEERQNRLRLLAQIRSTMNRVADFSKIEG